MSALADTPTLEFRRISKNFGSLAANRDISFNVARGEIHGIVGENGAGKSTLMSILAGLIRADSGAILIDGKPVEIASPADAIRLGVGMVHQHFMLVETMSVLDNILLGREGGPLLARGRAAMRETLATLARDHGLAIDPDATIAGLPVGLRQRVEIMKALARGARILALDEPTAALTPNEAASLSGLLRNLAANGASILFVTHKLHEVLELTDKISVLRAGERVATVATSDATAESLAEAMVGRRVATQMNKPAARPGALLLQAADISLSDPDGRLRLDRVSLSLCAGEIVGLAGVAGNGQSELLDVLSGMRKPQAGTLQIAGRAVDLSNYDPARARAHRLAHIPEDRLRYGAVAAFPASENAALGQQRNRRFGARLLDPAALRAHCAGLMQSWDVRPRAPDLAFARFSGGNQQKLVFAREVDPGPQLLIVGQPTRGVDIGAIEALHSRLLDLRGAGAAILLVSVELDEILTLSDRVLTMHAGRIVGECNPDAPNARQRIGLMMAGSPEIAA